MKPQRLWRLFAVVISLLTLSGAVSASDLKLGVNLATPVMETGKQQSAFVKISLEGIEKGGVTKRLPANVAIVLDKSGSMNGKKIRQARQAAIMAISRLDPEDIVSVVSYDTYVEVVVPATRVSDRQAINRAIRNIRADGNTALFAGVSKGAAEVRKFLQRQNVNRVILLSDGLANVGPSAPHELGELGASLGREGISVTTLGLGLGYNEDLMTQLAGFSDGNHAFIENADDLARIFQYEFGDVLSVVAQGVEIEIRCLNGVKPLRILGRNGEIQGPRIRTRMNQLYSAQQKYILLEVTVPPQVQAAEMQLVDVAVNYQNPFAGTRESLQGLAVARFSQSEDQVKAAVDKETYQSAVEQVVNEMSREAVQKRDQGDISAAKKILEAGASYLRSNADSLAAPELLEQEAEVLQDAEELDDDAQWNRKRKELKARQYKRATQQTY
ncbi:vWA domain-containing protein [Marinobacterium jannaschii]|uniref:vWA domain-containing protein n=1 Tax=Marinobacterium jannaschii TaxID=64970 RepID=UPI00048A4335|nr:VWA domain-containing protein [Marinobacterium jannaschii]